jgi:hypothetical protein
MKLAGKTRNTWGKTCSSATLSTTNPTWTDPGSNPGRHSGRPATNRLRIKEGPLSFEVHIKNKQHQTFIKPKFFYNF